MENRRREDPWQQLIELKVGVIEEKLEKNNMMTAEMLEAWDTIKGGMKALQFLAKMMKILGTIAAAIAGIWGAVEIFFRKGG